MIAEGYEPKLSSFHRYTRDICDNPSIRKEL